MDFVITVGIPIVCLVYGIIFGSSLSKKAVEDAVEAGYELGIRLTHEGYRQALTSAVAEIQQEPTEPNNEDNMKSMQYGFDLKGN